MKSYNHHSLTNSPASSPACSTHSIMKTAVIYARYSSDNQSEQSIEGQLRTCQEYAKNNNILILDTYIDRAMTGTNDHRPDFQRMIKDSSNKNWNYVIVYKLDRFSRNKYEIAMHKKTLKDNGVKLVSAMEYIPDSPEAIIIESMLEGYAEYYSAELSQKIKRGMKETRIKGFYQGGTLPYGYKLDGRKIVIDQDKISDVEFIFNQYASGNYVSNIVNILTSKGVLNHGKPFAYNTIYNMLRNECYTGIYRHKEEIITNMYPQIISTELFSKVRERVNKNKYGKGAVTTTYLFKHKLFCGYCGCPISAECGTAKNGTKKNYYKCIGRKKHHNGCTKSTLRKEEFEKYVLDIIINELNNPNTIDIMVQNLLKIQDELTKENTNLKLLLKSQKQVQTALNNIMLAVEQGVINKTTNARMKELESQIETLEEQILIEKNRNIIKLSENAIREYYIKALENEPLLLINTFIKDIVLFDDEIKITFNSPIRKSPDNNGQGFSLCKILYLNKLKTELYV